VVTQLLENALTWLRDNYRSCRFFAERDIVWTLQMHMICEAESRTPRLNIYDNHKLLNRKQVDLAILSDRNTVDVVVEVKYEPDHRRTDISPGKLKPSKVYWKSKRSGGVEPDIDRVREFVMNSGVRTGYALFIDEGSHFKLKPAPKDSHWEDWGESPYSKTRISVLIARFPLQ